MIYKLKQSTPYRFMITIVLNSENHILDTME